MRVSKRGMRDERRILIYVVGSGNVVPGFIPEVGKTQQGKMSDYQARIDQQQDGESTIV